jgi:spectinomycin phosphotransferase
LLLPSDDVDVARLRRAIASQYAVPETDAFFVGLGEDSWAYQMGDLWISLRRDLRGHVPAAYETAYELRAAGLDFVLAPFASSDGEIVCRIEGRPVVVFPFVPSVQLTRESAAAAETEVLVAMLEKVHATHVDLPLPTEDFRLGFGRELDAALRFARGGDQESDDGYRHRLRRLLRRHDCYITKLRSELGELAEICAGHDDTHVLTHGEPSAQNVLRHDGGLMLADWGGAAWGPPERDWFHLVRTLGIKAPEWRREFLAFYQIRWILSEITEYAVRFQEHRGPGDADDAAMWGRLTRYLPETPHVEPGQDLAERPRGMSLALARPR